MTDNADELLQAARGEGWEHTTDRTPLRNFQALIDATADIDAPRSQYTEAAWKEIMGLGPGCIDRTYSWIEDNTDTTVPPDSV